MALDAGSLVFQVFPKDDPLGTANGTLSNAYRKSVTVEDNGIGGGSFAIHPDDAGASWCEQDAYVAAWRDTVSGDPIAGFWIDAIEEVVLSPDEAGGKELRVSGRGPIAILDESVVWHKAISGGTGAVRPAKGDWRWANAHPARPFVRLLEEAQARGGLAGVTWDFTRTLDSASTAWSADAADEYSVAIGTSMLDVVRELRETGLHITMDAGLVIHAYDAYTNDLSGSINFTAGTDIRDTSDIEAAARRGKSVALMEGEAKNGSLRYRGVRDATIETALGRRKEGFFRFTRTATGKVLDRVGNRKLTRWKKQHDGPFVLGVIDTTNQVALVDYQPGDTVGVPTAFIAAGKERISAITLAEIENGEYDPTLEFGDLAPDPLTGVTPSGDIEGGGCCGGSDGAGKKPGGGSGGTGGGGSGGGGGTPTNAAPYVMEDFAGDGEDIIVVGVADGVAHVYNAGDTTATVSIPANWDAINGRYVFVFIHADDDTNIRTEMEAEGFTQATATVGSDWFYRRVDGTETWDPTSFDLAITGATPELGAVSMLLSGVYEELPDNPGMFASVNTGATADPDSVPAPAWAGQPAIAITTLRTDGSAITGGPTGYTEIGTDDGTGIDFRGDYKIMPAAAEDPSTYTATGVEQSVTYLVRGGGTTGWGAILQGEGVETDAPWPGGNIWDEGSTQNGNFYLSGGAGLFVASADNAIGSMALLAETEDNGSTEPWGPWADSDGMFLFRFKTNVLGDLADTTGNQITFTLDTYNGKHALFINLGDDVTYAYMSPMGQRGIGIQSGSATPAYDFAAKTITADTWTMVRFDTRGSEVRARLWDSGDTEPTTWDVSLTKDTADTSATDDGSAILRMIANSGMTYSFDYIDAQLGMRSGSLAGRHFLAYGDGSTTTFDVGQPYALGTLLVWVDNQPVIPTSFDPAAGTFTLSRAPYGDPAGSTGSAVVEVSFEAA